MDNGLCYIIKTFINHIHPYSNTNLYKVKPTYNALCYNGNPPILKQKFNPLQKVLYSFVLISCLHLTLILHQLNTFLQKILNQKCETNSHKVQSIKSRVSQQNL